MPEITKQELTSMNIKEEQLLKLKQLFPEIFTEGLKVDWEKLRLTLGDETVDTGKERYGMNFPGKAECFKTIQQPSIATLIPEREESIDFDSTQNLFIEGDNLEVLKLLQKSYIGKIKVLYFDPPYNTGNDFIYPDNYSESLDTYLTYTGQIDSEGKKFATNTETDGRFHSKWLSMMFPRLFLAKNLLKEDGAIFISIDDNELNNLKALCNEIFGEENFIGCITVMGNPRGRDYGGIARMHDYILVYGKSLECELNNLKDDDKEFPYTDNISGFEIRELRNRNIAFHSGNRPNLYYPFYVNRDKQDENGFYDISLEKRQGWFELYPKVSQGFNTVWRWGKEKSKQNLNINIVAKEMQDSGFQIVEKYRDKTKMARSIWFDKDVNTEKGTLLLKKLFESKVFPFPKPVELIQRCIEMGSQKDEIILDIFAGSCSTAHAVFNLNCSPGNNRKFICVQLPQQTEKDSEAFKAGYSTVAEIGKERIRRVINKIKEDNKNNPELFKIDISTLDLGFKVYKLAQSNFKIWDSSLEKSAEIIQEKLFQHIHHISPEAEQEAILYELLLKSGFELTTLIEKLNLAGKTVFSIAEGQLLICLEKELTHDCLKAMAEMHPTRVICLDEGFKGENADALKTNAVQIMKSKGVLNFRTV